MVRHYFWRKKDFMFTVILPVLVLVISLAAQAFFCDDFRPYLPLFFAAACAVLLGLKRGRSWDDLAKETFQAVGSIASTLILYILIGPIISSWIASGTLPALIIWGSRCIGRTTYLPLSFVLAGITSILMGSGVSAFGTIGVAIVSIGQAMGFPLWIIAAVLGSGAFWGNAASPIATVNCLAVAITGGSQEEFNSQIVKRTLPHFIISLVCFTLLGFFYSPAADVPVVSFTELAEIFHPDLLCMVPPIVLIVLVIIKTPTLPVFFLSIAAGVVVALLKGTVTAATIPQLMTDGYRYLGNDAVLAAMLNRGGIVSTDSIIFTVLLAMLFGGSYQASGCLAELLEILTRRVKTPYALRRLAVVCVVFATIVTGSATIGTALIGTLFLTKMKEIGLHPIDMAFAIAPVSLMFCPALPWGISGTTLLSVAGMSLTGGDLSCLLYVPLTFTSFIGPIYELFVKPKLSVK